MSRITRISVIAAFVVIVGGIVYAIGDRNASVEGDAGIIALQYTDAAEPVAAPAVTEEEGACSACITEGDNGATVSVLTASQLVIELPTNAYKKTDIVVEPEGVLGAASTTKSSARDLWAVSFEALQSGTTSITVASAQTNVRDFILNVVVSPRIDMAIDTSPGFRSSFLSWF